MICALCQNELASEDSHIIPAFVLRWLKDYSLTGFVRGSEQPNRRVTDLPKPKLLGIVCEDLLSKWESEFASKLFHQVHRGGKTNISFEYDDWLPKFAASLCWRTLSFLKGRNPKSDLPHGHSALIDPTLGIWREYLLGHRRDVANHGFHILILDHPIELPAYLDQRELSLYLDRGIDYNTIHAPDEGYVMIKLCRILIAGTITDTQPQQWVRTQIDLKGGTYSPGDFRVSGCFFTFCETAIRDIVESRKRISKKQVQKMEDALRRKLWRD